MKEALYQSNQIQSKFILFFFQIKVVQISEVPMFSAKQTRDRTLIKIDESVFLPPGSSISNDYTLSAKMPKRE